MSIELRSGRRVRMHAARLAPGWSALVLQDLASSHHAAENRAVSELHSLIDWIDQGVLLFDEAENLRAVNQRFKQIFGLSPEDLAAGANLRDLVGLIAPHVADPPDSRKGGGTRHEASSGASVKRFKSCSPVRAGSSGFPGRYSLPTDNGLAAWRSTPIFRCRTCNRQKYRN